MAKTTEEEIEKMIQLYEEGNTFTDIAQIVGKSSDTVSKHLRARGYHRGIINNLLESEMSEICNWYINCHWDKIFSKYKFMNKQRVYSLASNLGFKKESYFWTQEDTEILIANYGKPYEEIKLLLKEEHSIKAISTKAINLGLTQPQEWTESELEILKTYYSILPKEEFIELLPRRTEDAIVCKAMKLGIKSFKYLNEKYTDEEEQFIIDNAGIMTDDEIANVLNRGIHGIQDKRRSLGMYYLNKDYSNYDSFAKFFRGHVQDWKTKSMEKCNYKCVISESKNFAIHHLYGFNLILKEVFEKLDKMNLLKSDNLEDYSKEELDNIIDIFQLIHSKYPLGVCVDKDIHDLFHKIYGAGGNTEEQWNKFVIDYNNNKYDELLAS